MSGCAPNQYNNQCPSLKDRLQAAHKPGSACYIAGPMRGYPKYNFPAFDDCKVQLKSWGFRGINPADLDRAYGIYEDSDFSVDELHDVIRRDINGILSSDFIVLLPGFENSQGAIAELQVACWYGIPAYCLSTGKRMSIRTNHTVNSQGLVEVHLNLEGCQSECKPADCVVEDKSYICSKSGEVCEYDCEPEDCDLDDEWLDELEEENKYLHQLDDDEDEDVLEEALRITSGDRNDSYGPPDADFKRTAAMWSALFGCNITSEQVALAMICLKCSRACWSPDKRDHWVDIAGYARCGHQCVECRKEEECCHDH